LLEILTWTGHDAGEGETDMKKWQLWTLVGLSGVFFVVVIVNISTFLGNRGLQNQVNNRQIYINQSIQLEPLNRDIISALANVAARNNDDALRSLLNAHGITFSVTPSATINETEQPKTPEKARR
jgi:hypothetical protein